MRHSLSEQGLALAQSVTSSAVSRAPRADTLALLIDALELTVEQRVC